MRPADEAIVTTCPSLRAIIAGRKHLSVCPNRILCGQGRSYEAWGTGKGHLPNFEHLNSNIKYRYKAHRDINISNILTFSVRLYQKFTLLIKMFSIVSLKFLMKFNYITYF